MATKTSKKEKTIKKTEETDTEHSSDEMETHSIWNGRFKRSPEDAKFFRDFLTDLNNEFIDEEGFEAILKHYWGDSIENLNKLITKQNKREKKVKETFKPEGLEKPKSAYNLYCKAYAKECSVSVSSVFLIVFSFFDVLVAIVIISCVMFKLNFNTF